MKELSLEFKLGAELKGACPGDITEVEEAVARTIPLPALKLLVLCVLQPAVVEHHAHNALHTDRHTKIKLCSAEKVRLLQAQSVSSSWVCVGGCGGGGGRCGGVVRGLTFTILLLSSVNSPCFLLSNMRIS